MKNIFKREADFDSYPLIASIVIVAFLVFIIVTLILYWYLIAYVYRNISESIAIIMVLFPILVNIHYYGNYLDLYLRYSKLSNYILITRISYESEF